MSEMHFIGDIHADFDKYVKIIRGLTGPSIQVGDFGIGFNPPPSMPLHNRFIRGNHDNPALCKQHPNYMGDYGFEHVGDMPLMYVSGAESVDASDRVEGFDWWRDEELSWNDLENVIEIYRVVQPEIVVSHEAPGLWEERRGKRRTKTSHAFDVMLGMHKPYLWVFGHFHPRRMTLSVCERTRLVCLPINGVISLSSFGIL